ncbi:putative serine threonine protein kinase protein [Rosellinia necatrix]|uniref:Putative serine threonine protein kinase protein n=1 Tax=Rosellinia necatrix TaxID=77044 RepID=A0A1S8A6A9_ROSNE|nr:putative serine threonine protein kinase protein [Rosellinia necatrix]
MSTSDYTVQTRHLRKRRFQDAKRAWKRIHGTLLPCQEAGYMRYRSVLGFGGFGVVQKWDVNKPNGTFDRTVAVKGLVNSWEPSRIRALKREVWWMKQFRGSEHLVQLVDLDPKLTGALEINREASDDIDPMIAMEELGRGSLALLIKRMLHMRKANSDLPEEFRAMEYIPNRALWHIFLCLTRACIGMAYPSSTREANSDGSIRESMHNIPPGVEPRKIVHCDIDIQNTFIADPEPSMRGGPTAIPAEPGSEHIYNPVIKIADYGCMVEWDDNWDTQTKLESLWGKRSYKAPASAFVSPSSNGKINRLTALEGTIQ